MELATRQPGTATAYSRVPKERRANLEFRRRIYQAAARDEEVQRNLWILCSREILFWINVFGWIFEPRTKRTLPWITWDFQDETLTLMDKNLGVQDIGIEKSRDMGASWMLDAPPAHRFVFHDWCTFLLISRTEALVDGDDPSALLWKFDFLINHLPSWMRPTMRDGFEKKHLHRKNPDNNSRTDGSSTTGDAGRADRRLAMGLDELGAFGVQDSFAIMAATQSVTNCRVFCSTPRGAVGAFHQIMHQTDTNMIRIRLHWSQHPDKRPGLYTSKDGRVEILDTDYEFPPDYPFVVDGPFHKEGGLRSPWYDRECSRPGTTPQMIAQELDIDYHGSNHPYFMPEMVQRVLERDGSDPLWIGELEHDNDTGRPSGFTPVERGALRLWCNWADNGKPEQSREYVAGADIATGSGASNSVMYVADRQTREVVAEYASAWVSPEEFARQAVALCLWFNKAFLCWEDNGPGGQFGRKVRKLKYRRFYWRKTRPEGVKQRPTDVPGWYSTQTTKKLVIGDLREAYATGSFVNHSREGIIECRAYKWTPTQSIVHEESEMTEDPTGARDNHGDRVIAAAMTLVALGERGPVDPATIQKQKDEAPVGSFLYRRQQREKAKKKREESSLVFC